METKTTVWITTSFIGFHRWKDAPSSVGYLRDFHRHIFHVKIAVLVQTENREVEFHTLKSLVNSYIHDTFQNQYMEYSCETIAKMIFKYVFHVIRLPYCEFVEVSEDGENGATVIRSQ